LEAFSDGVLAIIIYYHGTRTKSSNKGQKITSDSLRRNRRYIYVAVLFIAACITESLNGLEQLMIAIPSLLAFELSMLLMDNFKK
jgi:Sec-independent protein secretion pathway component TatC